MSDIDIHFHQGNRSSIKVDGLDVPSVRSVRVAAIAGKIPVVEVDCFYDQIKLRGEAEVRMVTMCPACEGRIAKTGSFITSPLAQAAYEAYADNRPLQGDGSLVQMLPRWDDLPEGEQLPWEHVARAIKLHGR